MLLTDFENKSSAHPAMLINILGHQHVLTVFIITPARTSHHMLVTLMRPYHAPRAVIQLYPLVGTHEDILVIVTWTESLVIARQ